MTAELTCPSCGTPIPNAQLLGIQLTGIYDGVLVWKDERCGHMWPRFAPDAASGYSRLHDKAVEWIGAES
jgi:hypothetical protein